MQDLPERVDNMNDSKEYQEIESNYSGKLSHVPSQLAVVPCERVVLGKGSKVLISESAQGTCPPHHGRIS